MEQRRATQGPEVGGRSAVAAAAASVLAVLLVASACSPATTRGDGTATGQAATASTRSTEAGAEVSPLASAPATSPLRRIGTGRAVAAATTAGVDLVATTAGAELHRDQGVTALPLTTLDPPIAVQLVPDGGRGLMQRETAIELWELGVDPRPVRTVAAGLAWALADDGSAVIASADRLEVVAPDWSSAEVHDPPEDGVIGAVAIAADGSWWFAANQGPAGVEVLVATDGGEPVGSSLDLPSGVTVQRAVADPSADRVLLDLVGDSTDFGRRLLWLDAATGVALRSTALLTDDVWDVGAGGTVAIVGTTDGRIVAADGGVTELGVLNDGRIPTSLHALDGNRFVAVLRDGARIVVDGDEGVVGQVPGTERSVTVSARAADRSGIAVVTFLGGVEFVDGTGLASRRIDRYEAGVVNDVEVADNDVLAIATSTGTVAVLPVEGMSGAAADVGAVELRHDEGDVQSVAFSPDGSRLLTGLGERFAENAYDDTVTLWETATQERLVEIGGEGEEVLGCSSFTNAVRYASDGSFLVGISHDFTFSVFDGQTLAPLRTVAAHAGPILSIDLSPDDRRLITSSQDDLSLRVWDVRSGELVAEHQTPLGGYHSIDYLPDGSGVLVSELSGQLSIIDPDTGATLRSFDSQMSIGGRPTVSPDGRFVAAGDGGVARLWSTETGGVVGELAGHSGFVTSAAFTEDGTRLVTGGTDGTAVVWAIDHIDSGR
ncbi:MAG: WD40 repeat domain-containing protein [Actinomycetota bacterium]